MEDDSIRIIELSDGQDEDFIVVMTWLFFTASFKDIYSSPHFPSSSQNRPPKKALYPKQIGECKEKN